MSEYRFDSRSKEEFEKDIKSRTMEERALFFMWLDLLEKETGVRPKFTDTGCGRDGNLLDDNKVSTLPDFEVEGYGKVEVKFSNPNLDRAFHLKVNQVKSYHQNGAMILMVNGAADPVPTFTILKPEALGKIIDAYKVIPFKGFGWKPAYRIPVKDFIWRPLK